MGARRQGWIGAVVVAGALGVPWMPLAGGVPPPGPLHGQDVAVHDEGLLAPLCNAQAEPHVTRTTTTVVAGWYDDRACESAAQALLDRPGEPPTELSTSAYAWSADEGRTWSPSRLLAFPGGQLRGDPVLAAGPDGAVFYASRGVDPSGRSIIAVAKSSDGGRTFGTPADASPALDPLAEQDKPWIAVDSTESADRGSVYAVWTEYVDPPLGSGLGTGAAQYQRRTLFSRSTDGGATFGEPIKLSVGVDLDNSGLREYAGVGAQVAVGPRGEVFVAYTDYIVPAAGSQTRPWNVQLWFTRSLDGGRTFAAPELIAEPVGIGHIGLTCAPPESGRVPGVDEFVARDYSLVLNGGIKVRNWVSMAIDTSGSNDPNDADFNERYGRVYLAVASADAPSDAIAPLPTVDESDIYLMYSDTGGVTWQGVDSANKLRNQVNDDTGAAGSLPTDQFHPMVAVDERGTVAVIWYDRRRSSTNTAIEVYAATATDGAEFSANVAVSDVDFLPPQHHNPFAVPAPRVRPPPGLRADSAAAALLPPIHGGFANGCNGLGEYNGITSTGPGEFLVVWGDNRQATEADAQSAVADVDVYADRITVSP